MRFKVFNAYATVLLALPYAHVALVYVEHVAHVSVTDEQRNKTLLPQHVLCTVCFQTKPDGIHHV